MPKHIYPRFHNKVNSSVMLIVVVLLKFSLLTDFALFALHQEMER